MRRAIAREDLRFVLLQAREPDDGAREEEFLAFTQRLQVGPEQIRPVDILTEPLGDATIDGADAILVGGSGEYSVLDDDPRIRRFADFLAEQTEDDVPIFASCFGFQALALGLGGEVIHDEDHAEVGTYELELTDDGARDPLFRTLPGQFLAQLGHKDRVFRPPEGVVCLARSPWSPFQAFRIPDKPIYATQFHPELTWVDNKVRFKGYMDQYGTLFGREAALSKLYGHRPSPEANELPARFVEQFVLGQNAFPSSR